MQYIQVGLTGAKVSRLALGTMNVPADIPTSRTAAPSWTPPLTPASTSPAAGH